MKFTVTTPPTGRPVTWDTARVHLRIDGHEERAYVEGLIDAATDHAQEALETSLMPQTITVVYYLDDMRRPVTVFGQPLAIDGGSDLAATTYTPTLPLPRGPVTGIVSVTDGNGHAVTNFTLERQGHTDQLRVNTGYTLPLTVVYTAGYADANAVPAGIRHAILLHVGTLYEQRESTSDKPTTTVPHTLDDFYRRRARGTGIG